jgi:hypothetical protein
LQLYTPPRPCKYSLICLLADAYRLLPVSHNPCQQIRQPISRKNYPTVSNPARANNVTHRKHGSRYDHRAIQIPTSRASSPPAVTVSNLRRNLEALFCPRLKVSVPKFGELAVLSCWRFCPCRNPAKSCKIRGSVRGMRYEVRPSIREGNGASRRRDPR